MKKSLETIKDEYAMEKSGGKLNWEKFMFKTSYLVPDANVGEIATRYAEQLAKDFSEWCNKNYCYDHTLKKYWKHEYHEFEPKDILEAPSSPHVKVYFTTEQLYQLYNEKPDSPKNP